MITIEYTGLKDRFGLKKIGTTNIYINESLSRYGRLNVIFHELCHLFYDIDTDSILKRELKVIGLQLLIGITSLPYLIIKSLTPSRLKFYFNRYILRKEV